MGGVYLIQYPPLNKVSGQYNMDIYIEDNLFRKYQILTQEGVRSLRHRKSDPAPAPEPQARMCKITSASGTSLSISLTDKSGKPVEGVCKVELKGPKGPVEVKVSQDNGLFI